MSGRQPSSVTTTQTSALPDWQRPFQTDLFNAGQAAINAQRPEDIQNPYGFNPQNQAQLTAQSMGIGRALSGSPLESSAQGYAYDALNGGGSNPYATEMNPYMGYSPMFNQMLQSSNQSIADGYAKGVGASNNIKYAKAGTLGGSAWNEVTADNEARLASSLAENTRNMQNGQWDRSSGMAENMLNRATGSYDTQQGRMNQILGMVPQLANMDYNNIDRMLGYGDRQFQYSQGIHDQLSQDWRDTRDFGMNQIDRGGALLRLINGTGGGSTVTQTGGGGGGNRGLLGGLGLSMLSGLF